MSSADKTRQSSGGRSLFSRNKYKDKDKHAAEPRYAQEQHPYDSTSRSSRHKRESSNLSIDRSHSPDPTFNQTAGVITSIPYDALTSGSRSPIPVEYLPKGDQPPVRRDLQPHQLNRGNVDYHQYPSVDPSSAHPYSSAQRPGTSHSNISMASAGRQAQYQQWSQPRGSMASSANGSHGSRYDSYISADNVSLYSGNQGNRDVGTGRSSQAALPSASSQSSYGSHHSHRESNRLTTFSSSGFGK